MRGIGLIRLRLGIIENPCECGIEPPGSISYGVSFKKELKCFKDNERFLFHGTTESFEVKKFLYFTLTSSSESFYVFLI